MLVLKMVADNGQEIGMFSWFAIHPVSMNKTNRLVSSDNIGYAAYLFEQEKNEGYLPGKGPYVAAFAASNLGDVSPNTKGPHCINTGEPCENMGSYCPVGGPIVAHLSGLATIQLGTGDRWRQERGWGYAHSDHMSSADHASAAAQ
ncbi:putative neutral ceramidase C [Python bivittatus]|uniref:Neutral ceramidase n=1 Tax=Python bivittatus TaxID=176946 RepID=A0A9F5JFS4_PYTBI|nr:putative neutral ceramidase C [Python bivittatus]